MNQAFFNAVKVSQINCLMLKLSYVEILRTRFPAEWDECRGALKVMPHIDFSSPHTSSHSSMRHRRKFHIIESVCRLAVGLQMAP